MFATKVKQKTVLCFINNMKMNLMRVKKIQFQWIFHSQVHHQKSASRDIKGNK